MKNLKDMNNTNMLKRLFTLLFVLGMGMATAWAYDFSAVAPSGQTLYYTITDADNHYVQMVAPGDNSSSGWNDYTKPTGDLTLPSVVNTNEIDYSVTSINQYAFYGCSGLTSVTFPNSVTTIGFDAFRGCSSLTSMNYTGDIAQWCEISFSNEYSNPLNYAHNLYVNNQLVTDLVIPNSVTTIGSSAFSGCSGLTSVTIPNSVTTIGSNAFYGCSGLTSVEIPNSVTSIGNYAFYGCSGLTSLTIGEGVTTIWGYAFWNCPNLTTVHFNAMNCTRMYVVEYNPTRYFSVFNSTNSTSSYTTPIVTLTIGDNVTQIPDYAFKDSPNLTSVTIPNSVTTIGSGAFAGCRGLTSMNYTGDIAQWCEISFGNEGSNPLYYAHNLYVNNQLVTDLVIPNSVTSIDNYAFYGCSGLTSVTIGNSVTSIGNYAFYNCSGMTSLTIGNSVTTIGYGAFRGCSGMTSLTIGNSVTRVEDYAFFDCSGLTSVYYMGDIAQWCRISWISYSSNPLQYAYSLYINNEVINDLVIPNTVTSIGNSFRYYKGLTSVEIPNSMTRIDDYAFSGCSGLTSVEIPNSVTSIGSNAFYGCSGLTSVEIPNSVTYIGSSAFYNCSGLTSVAVFAETPPTVGSNAFYNVSTNNPVYVPCESATAYQNASGWNNFSNITAVCTATIEASVSSITGGSVSGGGTFDFGVTCTLTATPNSGYYFWYWTENEAIVSNAASYSFPVVDDRNLVAVFTTTNPADAIAFSDANVKALCVANWDSNSDGELSYAEAGSVTTLGDVFKGNADITSFDELQYFTRLPAVNSCAFQDCVGLTSVQIPNSVTSIGQNAFYNCSSLTGDWAIPNSVTYIGSSAFYDCSGLTGDLAIPNSVTTINNYTFYGCSGIISVEIPNSVTAIGGYAFYGCSGLTLLTIGEGVTSIGEHAFWNCPSLTTLNFNAINCTMYHELNHNYYSEFSGDGNGGPILVETLNIGEHVTRIPTSAFKNFRSITSLEIPNSVTHIGNEAFFYCTSLTSLIIGNSVTGIGESAFAYCGRLASMVIFAETPPSICNGSGSYNWHEFVPSFMYVPSNIIVYVPCGSITAYEGTGWRRSYTEVITNFVEMCPYEINVSVTPAGAAAIEGAGTYNNTETCTLGYEATYGYGFLNWMENGEVVSTDDTYSFVVTEGHDITANFQYIEQHWQLPQGYEGNMTLTGIITIDGEEQTSDFIELAAFIGDECHGTALPINVNGQRVYFLTIMGDNADEGVALEFKLYDHQQQEELDLLCTNTVNYQHDVVYGLDEFYVLNFLNYVVITATADPAEGGTIEGAGNHFPGLEATLTATANTGYTFQNWTKNGTVVSTNAAYTFTVNEAESYVAHFTLNSYDLTVSADPTEGGSVTGGGTYNHFDECTLMATANTGYTFQNWTLNGEEVSTDAEYTFEVSGGGEYVAHFQLNSYEIAATADPAEGGTIDGAGTYNHFETCTLTATAATGYTFQNWTLEGEEVSTATELSFEVNAPAAYVAHFTLNSYEITAIANPAEGGTVSGSGTYNHFASCTLTATAADGYQFNSWVADGTTVSTDATYTFEVSGPVVATAMFDLVQTIAMSDNWTWWGTSVELSGFADGGLSMLEESLGDNGIIIKTSGPFVQNFTSYGMGWMGSLTELANEKGYKIQTNQACDVTMVGPVADPADHPIVIHQGWNWIGYPVNHAQNVSTALGDFEPSANDVIKGQGSSFSTYVTGLGWLPEITLQPGKSYLYYSNNAEDEELVYSNGRGDAPIVMDDNRYWHNDVHAYADNLCLRAVVSIDGVEQRNETIELGAFVNGECRGSAKLMYVEPFDRYYALMTVTGQDGDKVEFAIVDETRHQISTASDAHFTFVSDDIVGSFDNPYPVEFGTMTTIEEFASNLYIYPNPVNCNMVFDLVVPEDEIISEMFVINMNGAIVRHETGALSRHSVTGIPTSGLYLIRVVGQSGKIYQSRLIVR